MVEKKYNLWMDGEILESSLTKLEAEALLDECLDADDFDDEEHYYMIKPA